LGDAVVPRGRLPEPVEVLKARGGRPAAARGQSERPGPAAAAPACPRWLDKPARREWKRLSAGLVRLGLLCPLDGAVFTIFCVSFSQWRAAAEKLQAEGPVYARAGLAKLSPLTLAAAGSAKLALDCAEKLGLTAGARRRLGIALPRPQAEQPPLKARFFSTGGESG
jgi:P27 family predicted phage terminase small subunit